MSHPEMLTILKEMNYTVRVLKWYVMVMMGTFFLILRLIVAERNASIRSVTLRSCGCLRAPPMSCR